MLKELDPEGIIELASIKEKIIENESKILDNVPNRNLWDNIDYCSICYNSLDEEANIKVSCCS